MSTTREKIVAAIEKVIAVPANKKPLTDAMSMRDDLGTDSIDDIELIMEVEEAFDISISENEAAAATTVGDLVALVDKKLAE